MALQYGFIIGLWHGLRHGLRYGVRYGVRYGMRYGWFYSDKMLLIIGSQGVPKGYRRGTEGVPKGYWRGTEGGSFDTVEPRNESITQKWVSKQDLSRNLLPTKKLKLYPIYFCITSYGSQLTKKNWKFFLVTLVPRIYALLQLKKNWNFWSVYYIIP